MNQSTDDVYLMTFDSDASRIYTADTADLWQDLGVAFTGKNMGDVNGIRFSDLNGDVSSTTPSFFASINSMFTRLWYPGTNSTNQGRSDSLWLNDQGATVSNFPI